MEPRVDGILGSIQAHFVAKSMKKQNQTTSLANQTAPNPKTTSTLVVSTEVNAVQSLEYSGTRKKGKKKSKKPMIQQKDNKTQTTYVKSKTNRKAKFACLVCGGDHFTK